MVYSVDQFQVYLWCVQEKAPSELLAPYLHFKGRAAGHSRPCSLIPAKHALLCGIHSHLLISFVVWEDVQFEIQSASSKQLSANKRPTLSRGNNSPTGFINFDSDSSESYPGRRRPISVLLVLFNVHTHSGACVDCLTWWHQTVVRDPTSAPVMRPETSAGGVLICSISGAVGCAVNHLIEVGFSRNNSELYDNLLIPSNFKIPKSLSVFLFWNVKVMRLNSRLSWAFH